MLFQEPDAVVIEDPDDTDIPVDIAPDEAPDAVLFQDPGFIVSGCTDEIAVPPEDGAFVTPVPRDVVLFQDPEPVGIDEPLPDGNVIPVDIAPDVVSDPCCPEMVPFKFSEAVVESDTEGPVVAAVPPDV